ncbi:hypothetical protein PAECIP111891_03950 [Paenibacillus allorhizoplanae]|uniref:GNAT family N-acetyltransferase n=1 Tax=Paenibacillus allorhizoplanae TaxID=2905648 RepID=A0ABM9CHJ4_9BACL|nr:hypothetical protein [Paenibacillus allorhizoplanae]CAH1213320.1 hypothetical protein PAECIP111891_03950 [Paenibacillus allorhizoplanae]
MSFEFRVSEFEMDHEAYMDFLLRHHAELNLPYTFGMKLSFISSPLFLGKVILVINEESYDMVGAAGFGYGTGPGDYEDQHICQIEVAFIEKELRSTSLFVQGLRALVDAIKAGNPGVRQVQFWASATGEGHENRLFAKFLALPGSTKSIVNTLALYTVPFHELEAYCEWLR